MSEVSSKTCVNTLPRLFRKVTWEQGINFDIGGGRFDRTTEYLSKRGVVNLVYDPYNRTDESNNWVINALSKKPANTATISNVLCVIEDLEERLEVLRLAKKYTIGDIYITVYAGNMTGIPSISRTGTWQANRKYRTYIPEILQVLRVVGIREKVIICRSH